MTIASELRSISRDVAGELSPAAVVAWARAHPKSDTWADLKQACKDTEEQVMLARAGNLIRLHITKEARSDRHSTVTVRKELSLGRTHDAPRGGARPVERIKASPELVDVAYGRAIGELRSTRERFGFLKPLAAVWVEIDRAVRVYENGRRAMKMAAE